MNKKWHQGTFSSAAKHAYLKAERDIEKACEILWEIIIENPTLKEEVVDAAIHEAINTQMRHYRSRFFRSSQLPDNETPKEPVSAKNALIRDAQERLRSWFDYPLRNGDRLGDASKARLIREASQHRNLAEGNLIKERLFLSIAKRLANDDAIVSEFLTENDIEDIARGDE